jgi:hypothetical protein
MGYIEIQPTIPEGRMNVQLTTHPVPTRSPQPSGAQSQQSATVAILEPNPLQRLVNIAQDQQTWLALGVFCLLFGLILNNSGWSIDTWGYPIMLASLFLPALPLVAGYPARRKAQRTWDSQRARELVARKQAGRGFVYKLQSRDYSPAS